MDCLMFRHLHESSNRTLWNWNADASTKVEQERIPLIVPYGIETKSDRIRGEINIGPLIVPYGIETLFVLSSQSLGICL